MGVGVLERGRGEQGRRVGIRQICLVLEERTQLYVSTADQVLEAASHSLPL